jgi:hypothetical protein
LEATSEASVFDPGEDMVILLIQYHEVNELRLFQEKSEALPMHLALHYTRLLAKRLS